VIPVPVPSASFLAQSDTLRYEATVDDPRTWTQPWTVAFPLQRDPNYQLFEFACHEGNYSMPGMLRVRTSGKTKDGVSHS
jgi:hypothetical protein